MYVTNCKSNILVKSMNTLYFHFYIYDVILYLFIHADVDECAAGIAVCPRFRKCINTFGSYICKCHEGFDLQYINGKYQCLGTVTRSLDYYKKKKVKISQHIYDLCKFYLSNPQWKEPFCIMNTLFLHTLRTGSTLMPNFYM